MLFEKKYQAFNTAFHNPLKHLKVPQKYSPVHPIFNSVLSISSGDETLRLTLDILLPEGLKLDKPFVVK